MKIGFTKMHGLGNDFMVVDATQKPLALAPETIRTLADRRLGVGFDQLLLLEKHEKPNPPFRLKIYNADGSTSQQCGNGARCIARFIAQQGLSLEKEFSICIGNKAYMLRLNDADTVTVNMQTPIFEPNQIPFLAEQRTAEYTIYTPEVTIGAQVLSMGNPHCVVWTTDLETLDLTNIGRTLSLHPRFPEQTNVEFAKIRDRQHIDLRIYERGVGETPACGSGACAAVVAGQLLGQLDERVEVTMPGGTLTISWEGEHSPVWLTGPAVTVYEGQIGV
jgi:diaminopimelate epimerase